MFKFYTRIVENHRTAMEVLTFTSFWANLRDDKLMMHFRIFNKIGFGISYRLSPPKETICMKCQSIF